MFLKVLNQGLNFTQCTDLSSSSLKSHFVKYMLNILLSAIAHNVRAFANNNVFDVVQVSGRRISICGCMIVAGGQVFALAPFGTIPPIIRTRTYLEDTNCYVLAEAPTKGALELWHF